MCHLRLGVTDTQGGAQPLLQGHHIAIEFVELLKPREARHDEEPTPESSFQRRKSNSYYVNLPDFFIIFFHS